MPGEEKNIVRRRTLLQKIVNVFLYTGISLLILLMLALGFSQTSTFRELLRKNVVEAANKALNGKVSIGKIDGTIFTSLVLRNPVVSMGEDTLLNASIIEVKTSPLQIFLKRIYVRKLEILNARISLIADSSGVLNISKLVPPSKDTSHSAFPFKIIVPDFKLTNVDFSLQDYNKTKSHELYDELNLHDLRVKNINLSLSASADIKNNEYELKIDRLSLSPNLKYFNLKNLSGEFYAGTSGAYVNDLKIKTDGTDLSLDVKADDFNLFDSTAFASLNKIKFTVGLNAEKFAFNDLSSFIQSTSMLKGNVSAKLKASGTLKELNIALLHVDYLNSHLQLRGKIKNLDDIKLMNIYAGFNDTKINEPDIDKLLPEYGIPVYKNFGVVDIDTLEYNGNPLNFKAVASVKTKKGSADFECALDFRKPDMVYNINFSTKNLDLSELVSKEIILNSKGTISGSGVSPEKLNSSLKFTAFNSSFMNETIDSLRFNADAKNSVINFLFGLRSAFARSRLTGKFDFTKKDNPSYELNGGIRNLNLAAIAHDTSMSSDLNFRIKSAGSNFDLDKMNLYLTLDLTKSQISGVKIDSARTIVDIRSSNNNERVINIISDLADITLSGKFSVKQSLDLIAKESSSITTAFKDKLNGILYPDSVFNRQVNYGIAVKETSKKAPVTSLLPERIKYLVEFKNFDLLSLLLGNKHLRLDGDLSGEIRNSSDSIQVSINSDLDYVKYWSDENVFFLSNFNMKLNIANKLNDSSFSGISSRLHLSADRIFSSSDIRNILFDFNLNKNLAKVNISAQLENYARANIAGSIDLSSKVAKLDLGAVNLLYNNFNLVNKGNVSIDYSPKKIMVNNFDLVHNGGEIVISGSLAQSGSQGLKLQVKNIKGKDIFTSLLGISPENSLSSIINLTGDVKGNFLSPVIDINFTVDSISFRNTFLGSMASSLNYQEQNLNIDLKFVDPTVDKIKPALLISGNIPVDLSFENVKERFPQSKQMDLTLNAEDFKLGALGNLVPFVEGLKGNLYAYLKITGTFQNPNPEGSIVVKNADFLVKANNLEYTAGLKLNIKENNISVDSLLVANAPGTAGGGTITGTGKASMNKFNITSSQTSINGSLKVLSEDSKSVSPTVFGDLIIATNGDIEFNSGNQVSFLKAPLIVKEARLTFAPAQSAYQNTSDNFVYRYISKNDSTQKSDMDFESLLKLSQDRNLKAHTEAGERPGDFNYSIDVEVQDEAVIKFILSKELNQNLTAVLKGNFQYESIGGKTNAQGELTLLDGSTLEFLKTFTAAGTIRFESELNNPYLDIVATYLNYYTPLEPDAKEEPVAVKVKLNGPLKDLSKNFIHDKNNITVYVGADNISNDKSDPTKDVSDALMFVLTGKFASELTQQQQSQAIATSGAVSSTATSLAGSVLGSFLNRYLGDYVRGVELRSVGSTTRFNLVGKVKNFNYTVGGTTDIFQDLSQANVKIEYPVFKNFLIRVERKEAITQTATVNEMVNELGLKFRFEF